MVPSKDVLKNDLKHTKDECKLVNDKMVTGQSSERGQQPQLTWQCAADATSSIDLPGNSIMELR